MRYLLFGFILFGCALSWEHEIKIVLDDKCLTAFPECRGADTYFCVTPDGEQLPECRVGCLAARAIMCTPDGPVCVQRLGDHDEFVPVGCVTDE